MTQQTEKPGHKPASTVPEKQAQLDRNYGNIGIPAVAAALPYWDGAKNPAYAAPARARGRSQFDTRSVFAV